MKRLLAVSALVVCAAVLPPSSARAGTATNDLTVTANVLGICTIDPATLDFGNYDPSAGTFDGTGTGTITVHCTQGSSYWIGLGVGSHASGSTRRMAGGTAEFLTYELYRDAAFTTIWDNTDGGLPNSTASDAVAGYSAYDTTVYGQILGSPTVSTGAYSDTVTMTVNF